MRKLWLVSLLSIAGCTFAVPGFTGDDASGPIDAGGMDGPSGCDPGGANNHCSADGSSILSCNPDGMTFASQLCAFGCTGSVGAPRCAQLVPSGVVMPSDFSAAGPLATTIGVDTVFNVDDGSVTGGVTRAAGMGVQSNVSYRAATQAGGPKVGVFGFAGLTISAGATVTFVGKNAVAFVSSKDVNLAGTISLLGSCAGTGAGPGGSSGAETGDANNGKAAGMGGGDAGGANGSFSGGGGGGGFGDRGGAGGGGNGANGGTAGPIFGGFTGASIILAGGGGGGAGGRNATNTLQGAGGGGGGALQLSVSGDLKISTGGAIDAGGCGGFGGTSNSGGGGGGAGGAILLEAAHVTLESGSALSSNGGGGGGGDNGEQGTSGARGTGSGAGGTTGGSGTGGSHGGVAGAIEGGSAASTTGTNKAGGGGGGGVGRIALKTLHAMGVSDLGCAYSPDTGDVNSGNSRPTTFGAASFQ